VKIQKCRSDFKSAESIFFSPESKGHFKLAEQLKVIWRPKLQQAQTLEDVQPFRLAVVFRGEDACVEEDENDNNPVEPLRLRCPATGLSDTDG
jgi:hypothetical protein